VNIFPPVTYVRENMQFNRRKGLGPQKAQFAYVDARLAFATLIKARNLLRLGSFGTGERGYQVVRST